MLRYIDPRPYWSSLLLIVVMQLLAVLLWGWLSRMFIKLRYRIPTSSHQLFKQEDYTPHAARCPQRYPIVLVQYSHDGMLSSETFYTLFGDWIRFEYQNSEQVGSGSLQVSNLIMLIFLLPGLLMIVFLNLLKIVYSLLSETTDFHFLINLTEFSLYLFFIPMYSTFISTQVKTFLDIFYVGNRLMIATDEGTNNS